jgi:poly(3-hydroxybutyrate) depolymerase
MGIRSFAFVVLAATLAHADLEYAPGLRGNAGTWLVLGPYRAGSVSAEVKTGARPTLGAAFGVRTVNRESRSEQVPIAWRLAHSQGGSIDLAKELETSENNLVAFASTVLRVPRAGSYWLVASADDGLSVYLDGAQVQTRTGRQAFREDNELVPLTLSAGEHVLTVKLQQDNAGWAFHARLLNGDFTRASDLVLNLPGAPADSGPQASFTLDRAVVKDGYRLIARARAEEGVSLSGIPLSVDSADGAFTFGMLSPKTPELSAEVLRVPADKLEGAAQSIGFHLGDKAIVRQLAFRSKTREAIARAEEALRTAQAPEDLAATLEFLTTRLRGYVSRFDHDLDAQEREATELLELANAALEKRDPYAERTGVMRRAIRSPLDGHPSEFALYVPKVHPDKPLPLIVALHGMNGRAMTMLRWFFGGDDTERDQEWEDRHVGPLPYVHAIVVAPAAHGNAFYRGLGEESVLQVMDWVSAHYSVDPSRVTITGPSMGGIGTAALAFHYPNRFAAAAPLCGYHSAFIRGDVVGFRLAPWEHFMVAARSNVEWAQNGAQVPLYIVHGTKDLPETNSGVLIERYEKLGYSVKHEHPDLGHNVWQTTYEGFKGARWLLAYRKQESNYVRIRTASVRYGQSGFTRINELAEPGTWGEVQGRKSGERNYSTSTTGIRELALVPPVQAVRAGADADTGRAPREVSWTVDGTALKFDESEPLVAHKEGASWLKGAREVTGPAKRGRTLGPFRDIFHDALTFVVGTRDPNFTQVNADIARFFARYKPGTDVDYAVVNDDDASILDQDRSLFLLGNAKSNRVLEALEASLPIRVRDGQVFVGTKAFSGTQLGVAFTFPHPKFPTRMISVIEAPTPEGIFRAMSLPDLVPDFLVYDQSLARTQGQTVLGPGSALAAGFFDSDWKLPSAYAK